MAENKVDVSVPRHLYWVDSLTQKNKCPKCGAALKKEFNSYAVASDADDENFFVTGNDEGRFCSECPVVVLDKNSFGDMAAQATGKNRFNFSILGIMDMESIPQDKRKHELGTDENPWPLVEFANLRKKDAYGNEMALLKKAIDLESKKKYGSALKCISKILNLNPNSYHAHFLKARISSNTGPPDADSLKIALTEAIRQNAGEEVFELIEEEMKKASIDKNRFIRENLLNEFIEKEDKDIERAFRFTYYVELLNKFSLGKDQSHEMLVKAFFEFVDSELKVVKTDNGVAKEIFEMPIDEIKKNLLAFEKDEGKFYDDILEISYAFLGRNFFAYVHPSMLLFSASKENVEKMAKVLDRHNLKYHEPYELKRD